MNGRAPLVNDRRLLALFVIGEIGLFLLAAVSGPAAPSAIHALRDEAGAVIVIGHADAKIQESILVRANRADDADACAVVAARGDGAARLGASVFLFSSAGATELREHALEKLGPAAFELGAFVEEPLGFTVTGAASAGTSIVVVGIDDQQHPHARRFDGIAFSSLALPITEPTRALAITTLPGTADLLIAAAQQGGIELVHVRADGAERAGSIGVEHAAALAFADSNGPTTLLATTSDGEAWTVALDAQLRSRDPRRVATGLHDERLLTIAPTANGDVALWTTDASLRARTLDGNATGLPAWVGAQTVSALHFLHPLLLHFALLLIGAFALRPIERFEDAPILPLAPILRRALAFLTDFALTFCVALAAYFLITGEPAWQFCVHRVDPFLNDGVSDPLFLGLFEDVQLALAFVLTAYFACVEALFGCSLGKRLFGLRVVGTDGRAIAPGQALLRSLLHTFDLFINMGLLGAMVAVLTRRRQRLGDLVARTVVVRA